MLIIKCFIFHFAETLILRQLTVPFPCAANHAIGSCLINFLPMFFSRPHGNFIVSM